MNSLRQRRLASLVLAGLVLCGLGVALGCPDPITLDPVTSVNPPPKPIPLNLPRSSGFVLAPTVFPAAGVGGWASFTTNPSEPSDPALAIFTYGLNAGEYTVSVTSTVDGSVSRVGSFDGSGPHSVADVDSGEPPLSYRLLQTKSTRVIGYFAPIIVPLAANFQTNQVASVALTNSTGTVVLAGSPSLIPLTPGGLDHRYQRFYFYVSREPFESGEYLPAQARILQPNAPGGAATLEIILNDLGAGTYTASVTSLSTGTSTTLGTFDYTLSQGKLPIFLAFPAGLDPLDVASLQLTNATGSVRLSAVGAIPGGWVAGSENSTQTAALIPSTAAPVGSEGQARLSVQIKNGATTAALDITASGLAPGTDTVSSISSADGAVTVLGTFTVTAAHAKSGATIGAAKFGGKGGLPLPVGFNPLDIAAIEITDATGAVLLMGSLTAKSPTATAITAAKVRLVPGPAAPAAQGFAKINGRTAKGALHEALLLQAEGLPKNARFALYINGSLVDTISTGPKGAVNLPTLRYDSVIEGQKITSVTLQSAESIAVSAHF